MKLECLVLLKTSSSLLVCVVSTQGDSSDPQESFRLWLQRKHEQQQQERQLEEVKRLEQDSSYHIRSREECERAFKL